MINLEFVFSKDDIVSFGDIPDSLYNLLEYNIEVLMDFVEQQGGDKKALNKLELVDAGRIPLEEVVRYITPTCSRSKYDELCKTENDFALPCEFDDEAFGREDEI